MSAYDSSYVAGAQQRLGSMLDFAANGMGCDLADFYRSFLASPLSARFGAGDPAIVAGRSGHELAFEVMAEPPRGLDAQPPAAHALHATPEYWTGWALAFYQWACGHTFKAIESRVPIEHVRSLYHPFHEMDVRQFCDRMDELALASHPQTNLQALRVAAGLSQGQLAKASGVPVRTLQQYEQRQKNINHAHADCVVALARALACSPEELLEHNAQGVYEYAVIELG